MIGGLSLLFLTGAVVAFLSISDSDSTFLGSMLMRVGLTLGAIWLALPQLDVLFNRFPPWLWIWGIVGIAAATVRWNIGVAILGIVAVLSIFRVAKWFFSPIQPPSTSTSSKNSTVDDSEQS